MDPVAVLLVVLLVPVAGLVLAVLWWRRQNALREGPGAERIDPAGMPDLAQERRRRGDSRDRGLMG